MNDKQEIKNVWNTAKKVKITKIRLLPVENNDAYLKAVKFYTDDEQIQIMYYPFVKKTNIDNFSEFETETKVNEKYHMADFLLKYPLLVQLNRDCKVKPVTVILSYMESVFKGVTYYKMFENQFDTIYYEPFHKTDKSNIEKQKAKGKEVEIIEDSE